MRSSVYVVLLLLAAGMVAPALAEETFTAGMARMSGPAAGRSGLPSQLIMTVQEWSTPEERANLLKALQEGGEKGLLRALSAMDKGFVRYPTSTGWPINHAWSEATPEGGRIVRLVTERPILFGEAYRNTRTFRYKFGIVEMRFDAEGNGEGGLIPTAQVSLDENGAVVVEQFGTQAHRLLNVRSSQ